MTTATASQKPLAGAIATLRDQLHEAEIDIRQCDDEIRHLQGAPAGRDEVIEAVGREIEAMVAQARKPLADALLALAKNSAALHTPGHVRNVANGLADRMQSGRYLTLAELKPLLVGIAGSELLKRAVAESADSVTWPDVLSEANRERQIEAANRKRDGLLTKLGDLRRQAEAAGIEL